MFIICVIIIKNHFGNILNQAGNKLVLAIFYAPLCGPSVRYEVNFTVKLFIENLPQDKVLVVKVNHNEQKVCTG